jgi:hypothetical protein
LVATRATVWTVIVAVAPALPGVTDAGEKVNVAPGGSPVAVRAMGCVKAPAEVEATLIVYVAVFPPVMVCVPGLAVTEKSVVAGGVPVDVPVPVKADVCVPASSVTVNVALWAPAAVGAKLTTYVQVTPAAKLVPHVVLATLNTPAGIDAEAMFAFTVPVFDRVNVSVPDEPTATEP